MDFTGGFYDLSPGLGCEETAAGDGPIGFCGYLREPDLDLPGDWPDVPVGGVGSGYLAGY